MTQTTNYQLNQWAKSDRIMMDDFNTDNQKIDAAIKAVADGGLKLVTGSYVGAGSYGASSPNTLTFASQPKLVIIFGAYTIIAPNPAQWAPTLDSSGVDRTYGCSLTWNGNQLSWSNSSEDSRQCNTAGVTYHYIALLD